MENLSSSVHETLSASEIVPKEQESKGESADVLDHAGEIMRSKIPEVSDAGTSSERVPCEQGMLEALDLARKCLEERHEMRIEELIKIGETRANECHQAWLCQQDSIRELEKLRNELHFKSFYANSLENRVGELEEMNKKLEIEKKSTVLLIHDLDSKFQVLKDDYKRISEEARNNSLHETEELASAVECLGAQYENLRKKYLEESKERKELYNELLELKGNIRVFCRSRPLSAEERASGSSSVIEYDKSKENELYVHVNSTMKKNFKFDSVFTPEDDQEHVFAETAPVVVSVLDGYNVCIFAYGQTGTGKTFTMEGTPENRGVNYRTLQELFKVANERKGQFSYDISVSVLEVYNEQIRDLLASPDQQEQHNKKLEIRQSTEGIHHVPGLREAKVQNVEEAWEMLQTGNANRAVGMTNANEMSSRSHCILNVIVKAESLISGSVTRSKMWLVDLAGSERIAKTDAQGERLKEAQYINKSLSALGDVISSLTTKSGHIPYRNSKLTHLLQDSLGGNSKTIMFVQVSPLSSDTSETLCSLNFASRIRGIDFGPVRRQQDTSEVYKYKQMVEKIKQDGKEAKKMEESLQNLEIKFKGREQMCKNLQEKVKELEAQLAKERKARQQCETRLREVQRQSEKACEKPSVHVQEKNRRIPLSIKNFSNIPRDSLPVNLNAKQQQQRSMKSANTDKENVSQASLLENRKRRVSYCAPPNNTPLVGPARRVSMIPMPPTRKAVVRNEETGIRNPGPTRRTSLCSWPEKPTTAIPMPRRISMAGIPSLKKVKELSSPTDLKPPSSQFALTPKKNGSTGPSTPVSLRGLKNSRALQKFRLAVHKKFNVGSTELSEQGTNDTNLNSLPLPKLSELNANRLRRLSSRPLGLPPAGGSIRAQRVFTGTGNTSMAERN